MSYENEELRDEVMRLRELTARLFQFQAITLARVDAAMGLVAGLHASAGMPVNEVRAAMEKAIRQNEDKFLSLAADILGEHGAIPPDNDWWDRPPAPEGGG